MKFKLLESMTAVQDKLNPVLWDSNSQLKTDIKKKILELVEEFESTLDIPLKVLDINIVGSNASYNYNRKSDIDVHIITNFDEYGYPEELVQAAMQSFKANFNSRYDVKYKGYDVEIYVEDVKSSPQSNGIYSVLKDKWIKEPTKLEPVEIELEPELSECKDLVDDALKSNNIEQIDRLIDDLYVLRRNSLLAEGEFSAGNLIFKQIRNDGLLDALKDKRIELASRELSVESLQEGTKDTGFVILPNTIQACRNVIKSYYLNPKYTRGSKQAREMVVSRYNKRFNTHLNADDYVLHHRNGLHGIDHFENIVLLRKGKINHLVHHNDVMKAVVMQYAKNNGYKTGQTITPALFSGLSMNQQYKLLDVFLNVSELKTDRMKNNSSSVDVIYDSEL